MADFASTHNKRQAERIPHSRSPQIPGYPLIESIGSGASATTWLADRDSDQQRVVLKVLHPELMNQKTLLQRFIAEDKVISSLDNPC